MSQCAIEDFLYRVCESLRGAGRESLAACRRAELRAPQRLRRVDVADAGEHRLIEDQLLEHHALVARARVERGRVDAVDERIGPEDLEPLVLALGAADDDVDLSEPPRIDEAQLSLAVEPELDVRV